MESRNNKSINKKRFLFIFFTAYFSLAIIGFILTVRSSIKEIKQRANQIETLYGDISFSGEVIDYHPIKHSIDPPGAIMCIKIDSSTVDSFYHYDRYTALKIDNGIATLPLGQYDVEYKEVVYVHINEAGSHKMLFIIDENDTITEDLYYTSSYMYERDLKICDTCS
ncbi:MAG: hypothetical protein K5864_05140 [Bacteroidales bacterium]|nr:hypothetical protein [Bacteroidales bacterium]